MVVVVAARVAARAVRAAITSPAVKVREPVEIYSTTTILYAWMTTDMYSIPIIPKMLK